MEDKKTKLLTLRARKIKIKARGKWHDSPGVLNKVTRGIKNLEKELGSNC